MISILKDKKAISFSGWMEIIVFSVAIVIAMGIILSDLNTIHGENYTIGLGTDDTVVSIHNLESSLKTKTDTGTVSFLAGVGIITSTIWDIVTLVTTLLWTFIGGNWITTVLSWMHMDATIALLIRGIWFISIGFIIMKIFLKVRV